MRQCHVLQAKKLGDYELLVKRKTEGGAAEETNFRRRPTISGTEATLVWEKVITMTIHHGERAT